MVSSLDRKYFVLSISLSRSAVVAESISKTLMPAAVNDGVRVLEKRYGRERWRSMSMISRRPVV